MLKFYCALTGDDHELLSKDTPKSKQKVVTMGTVLLIPIFIWGVVGYLLSREVMHSAVVPALFVSIGCAFLIFLVERTIVMAASNRAMSAFRVILGFVVALIGALALDEVIMKDDIDHQLNINKLDATKQAKDDEGRSFDLLYRTSEVSAGVALAKKDYDTAEATAIKESNGEGSGKSGVGDVALFKNGKAEGRKKIWLDKQAALDTLLKQKEAAMQAAGLSKEHGMKDGLMVRIKALFQMVFSDPLMAIVYIAFTILMFCLEFIVVLVKMNSPETNYERKLKLIEELGERRMKMLQQTGSPLVSPDYALPHVVAAREAMQKKNGSLLN